MNLAETADLLGLASAYDNRKSSDAQIVAWQAALSDVDAADAMQAVVIHHQESTDWLKPAHVRRIADHLDRARRRAIREEREQLALEAEAANRGTLEDRAADVDELLVRLRDKLGPSDPVVLRRAEWVKAERRRQRANDAGPNPLYDPKVQAQLFLDAYGETS